MCAVPDLAAAGRSFHEQSGRSGRAGGERRGSLGPRAVPRRDGTDAHPGDVAREQHSVAGHRCVGLHLHEADAATEEARQEVRLGGGEGPVVHDRDRAEPAERSVAQQRSSRQIVDQRVGVPPARRPVHRHGARDVGGLVVHLGRCVEAGSVLGQERLDDDVVGVRADEARTRVDHRVGQDVHPGRRQRQLRRVVADALVTIGGRGRTTEGERRVVLEADRLAPTQMDQFRSGDEGRRNRPGTGRDPPHPEPGPGRAVSSGGSHVPLTAARRDDIVARAGPEGSSRGRWTQEALTLCEMDDDELSGFRNDCHTTVTRF